MFRLLSKFFAILDFVWGLVKEGLGNPFKNIKPQSKGNIVIMANGPSLREYMEALESQEDTSGKEFFAINDLVNYPFFVKVKPKHYALSDPMFFWDTVVKERGLKAINNLKNLVTWPMNLYIPWSYRNKPYINIVRDNPNINIIPFHSVEYPLNVENEKLRNYFFKKGLGNGQYSTVALNAIYIAITIGYKNIELQGVDHTFFTGLCLNEDNIPCNVYEYASDEKPVMKPMRYWYSDIREYKDMALFTYEMYRIFYGHKVMSSYAKSMNATILNATKGSLIDTYERI